MATVCHLGCLKEAFHTLGDGISNLHTELCEDFLIGGRDIPQIRIQSNGPWQGNSASGSNFDAFAGDLHI